MRKLTRIGTVLVSSCAVLAGGCSLYPIKNRFPPADNEFSQAIAQARTQGNSELLVALDLVGALVQISEMNPARVVLKMDEISTSFDRYVQSALNWAGYHKQSDDTSLQSLSLVAAVNPTNRVTSWASEASRAFVKTYQIKIRNITLRRDYLIENGRIEPRSWMHINGVNAIRVKLDDSIFDTPAIEHAKAEQQSTTRLLQPDGTVLKTSLPPDLPPTSANIQLPDTWSEPDSAPPLHVRTESQAGSAMSVGDPIRIIVEAGQDSQIHCYYEDSAGTVARVFPNRYRKDSTLHAGATLVLPESNRWQLSAPLADETDKVMCLALAPEENDTKPLLPDLLPIVASNLGDILNRYEAATGTKVINRKVSITVN